MKLSLLILGSLLFSALAIAAPRHFECNFSDGILLYRDLITLKDGGLARVESSVASAGGNEGSFACVDEAASYTEQSALVRLSGTARCADGSEGAFEKTLDLKSLQLNGGWQGAVSCRAL